MRKTIARALRSVADRVDPVPPVVVTFRTSAPGQATVTSPLADGREVLQALNHTLRAMGKQPL